MKDAFSVFLKFCPVCLSLLFASSVYLKPDARLRFQTPEETVDVFMEAALLNKRWISRLMQQLLTILQTGETQQQGWMAGRMDAWMDGFYRCFFTVSLLCLPLPFRHPSVLSLSVLWPSPLYQFPFLSISHPSCPPAHTPPSFSDLLFTSLLWLSLLPLTPEIPPTASGHLKLHRQSFPLRKRNKMENKRSKRGDR